MVSSTLFAYVLVVVLITLATATPTSRDLPELNSRTVTNSSKAGLGWPNGNTVDIQQYEATGKVSWYYTWSPAPINSNLEFVPMFWGEMSIDQFTSTIQATLTNSQPKVTEVLGMNEPEQAGQSNLTAQEGMQLWQTYLEPLHGMGLRVGSPAPSSSPAGKTWLQDFFTACNGNCTVDFIAMHWYGTDAQAFIAYLEDYHNTFQLPLWITEWACQNYVDLSAQCSADDIANFLNVTQSFMDATDYVERYAWYGAMENMGGVNSDDALMDGNGIINALGKQYIGSESAQSISTGDNGTAGLPIGFSRGSSSFSVSWLSLSMVFAAIALNF